MSTNSLHRLPLDFSDDDQFSLPFEDVPTLNRRPITSHHVVGLSSRHRRSFELTVHQDPVTLEVLAYCLHPITKH